MAIDGMTLGHALDHVGRRRIAIGLGVVAVAALALTVVTPVPADRAALVLRFGQPVRVINAWRATGDDAGLAFRWPIAERVVWLDRRLMTVALDNTRVTTGDGQPLMVDAYATWRVTDPVRFYQALGTPGQAFLTMLQANCATFWLRSCANSLAASPWRTSPRCNAVRALRQYAMHSIANWPVMACMLPTLACRGSHCPMGHRSTPHMRK